MGAFDRAQRMDTSIAHKKSHTKIWNFSTRDLRKANCSIVVLSSISICFFILFGCQTGEKTAETTSSGIQLPDGYEHPEIQVLTDVGINDEAQFSPDGKSVAFISSQRPRHNHPQIYVKNLKSGMEKRITYHDGSNTSVSFSPRGHQIIYSSTTDEIKENPTFIRSSLARLNGQADSSMTIKESEHKESFWQEEPYEIYISLLNGSRIERLTTSPNYDSEADFHPKGEKVIYVSSRKTNLDLHLMSTDGTYLRQLTDTKEVDAEPHYSPDGQTIAWVKYASDLKQSQIVLADPNLKTPKNLTEAPAIHWNPDWHPDGEVLIFSSNKDDKDNYELYSIRTDGSCLQRLTWHTATDIHPQFSPDGKKVLFTSTRNGEKQIFLMDYKPPKTCPKPN